MRSLYILYKRHKGFGIIVIVSGIGRAYLAFMEPMWHVRGVPMPTHTGTLQKEMHVQTYMRTCSHTHIDIHNTCTHVHIGKES